MVQGRLRCRCNIGDDRHHGNLHLPDDSHLDATQQLIRNGPKCIAIFDSKYLDALANADGRIAKGIRDTFPQAFSSANGLRKRGRAMR